jgi:hypothetical protein
MAKCNANSYYNSSFPGVENFYGPHHSIRLKIVLANKKKGLKNIRTLNKCYTYLNNNNNNNKLNNLLRKGM